MAESRELDLGPLTWVKSEIDLALAKAGESLDKAGQTGESLANVQFAQTHLHQACGALSIVGLDGLTQFANSLEQLFGLVARGERSLDDDLIDLGRRALAAIGNYLEELVHGTPDQPLRLFRLYAEIVTAAERRNASQAELFYPDMSLRPPRDHIRVARTNEVDRSNQVRAQRTLFQRGLLRTLRNQGDAEGAREMLEAATRLEPLFDKPAANALWLAARAFFESLAAGALPSDPLVKRICSALDKELGRDALTAGNVPERLMRELLYFAATSPAQSRLLKVVRDTWKLATLIPEPGAHVSEIPLAPLLKTLRMALASVKHAWDEFAGGKAAALPNFEAHLSLLRSESRRLGRPMLERLLDGLAGFTQWLRKDPLAFNEVVAIEVAAAQLLVESALGEGAPEAGFGEQVSDVLSRLTAISRGEALPAADHSAAVESARRVEEREALNQVSREILSNLSQIEQRLDDFFRNQAKRIPLAALSGPLKQIEGALALIDDVQATDLIRSVAGEIDRLAQGTDTEEPATFEALAHQLSALGFYIKALEHGRADLKTFLTPPTAATPSDEEAIAPTLEHADLDVAAPDDLPVSAPTDDYPVAAPSAESMIERVEDGIPAAAPAAEPAATEEEAVESAPAELPPQLPPSSEDLALDAELLEIFMEEAHEVLETIHSELSASIATLPDTSHLTPIRRGFHTLKGSGRMVGLQALGDVAWEVEQTLNQWLQLEYPTTTALHAMISDAHRFFSDWVADIESGGSIERDAAALIASAEALREGAGDTTSQPAAPEVAAMPVPAAVFSRPAESDAREDLVEEASSARETDGEFIELQLDADVAEDQLLETSLEDSTFDLSETRLDGLELEADAAAHERDFTETSLGSVDTGSDDTDSPNDAATRLEGLPPESFLADTALFGLPAEDVQAEPEAEPGDRERADLAHTEAEAAEPEADELQPADEFLELDDTPFSEEALDLHVAADATEEHGTEDQAALDEAFATLEPSDDQPVDAPLEISMEAFQEHTEGVEFTFTETSVGEGDTTDTPLPDTPPPDAPAAEELFDFGDLGAPAPSLPTDDDTDIALPTLTVPTEPIPAHTPEPEPEPWAVSTELNDLDNLEEFGPAEGSYPATEPGEAEPDEVDFPEPVDDHQGLPVDEPARDAIPQLPVDLTAADDQIPVTAATSPLSTQEQEASAAEPAGESTDTAGDESDRIMIGEMEIPRPLLGLYLEEAAQHIARLHEDFAQLRHHSARPPSEPALRAAHTLAGISGTARLGTIHHLAKALEHGIDRVRETSTETRLDQLDLFEAVTDRLEAMVGEAAKGIMPLAVPEFESQLEEIGTPPAPQEQPGYASEPAPAPVLPPSETEPPEEASPPITDDLDEQLLPIFLEEGADLLAQLNANLRRWNEDSGNPDHANVIARLLHTLKGSARMTGAMTLGEQVHQLESRLEAGRTAGHAPGVLIDDLTNGLDQTQAMVDAIASGEPLPAAVEAAVHTAATPGLEPTPAVVIEQEAQGAESGGGMLRVRADTVDRLVNEAGEIGIARTRIEGELRTLRRSMLDLTENVIRLRNQLREVEIQADVQMQSRIARAEHDQGEFDPLEMDRYTRLQELTRLMAESVADVTTVQQNLLRNLDGAELALHGQARMSRDLQQALMQIRMVPFDSLADRLYRVVRQSAKDLGKRVNLDIRGGRIEIDRSVLEHITPVLEHLLRNGVAHGIESGEARRASGKDELGQITLTVTHEANEIVLSLADDGRGLDYDAIAARARERGLLGADESADTRRLTNLIFVPGFSTAESLSAISGRGVGMDVVKSETAAVGGRIDVFSTAGQGTHFRVFLPLTLAVTQAVLVRGGGRSYAIPSSMVAQVIELKAGPMQALIDAGGTDWNGEHFAYRYMRQLLGETSAQAELGRFNWLLLLRAGAQTLALHVDQLRGNQEIVVKNAGPQLTRIIGISGATVLGDGEIVLILNPVALASRSLAAESGGAEAHPDVPLPAQPAAPPQPPLVMVVDDSLTVRKITGRLLEREGYRVLTAKDGTDALEKLLETVPDVILSDIEMPRMDGFDLVRNIRADARLIDIPIIMITSRLADKHREYAFKVGANHYLGKPYEEGELLGLIRSYVSG